MKDTSTNNGKSKGSLLFPTLTKSEKKKGKEDQSALDELLGDEAHLTAK